MKIIIAGGRNYTLTQDDFAKLDKLYITEVVSGCALGVDKSGERYAISRSIPVKPFPANWRPNGIYDCSAGNKRNRQMAEYADGVALFIGGKGTANMRDEAIRASIIIYELGEVK